MTSIIIRPATLDDVAALRELIRESVQGLSKEYYSATQVQSALVQVFGVDSQLIIDGTYFIAEINQQLAGSGGWSKRKTLFGGDQFKSDQDELLDPATEAARIRAFYVHPSWSRRGVGASLIGVCENAARDAGFSRIELVATLPGVPLYLANGYSIIRDSPISLADGQSLGAFLMAKDL